jgi:hypothetical protein
MVLNSLLKSLDVTQYVNNNSNFIINRLRELGPIVPTYFGLEDFVYATLLWGMFSVSRPMCLQFMMMIMLMGWDYVSELRPHLPYFSSPRWYISMENTGEMLLSEENS